MPMYRYWCRTCERSVARMSTIAKRVATVECPQCEATCKRQVGCNIPTPRAMTLHSVAMGVAPNQILEAKAYAEAHGLTGFQFDENGDLDFAGKRARRDFAEVHGFHDNDGGYGDPTPTSESRKEEIEYEDVEKGWGQVESGDDASDGGFREPLFLDS